MRNSQTIAMAETLLADGRSGDVLRMLEPLTLRPVSEETAEDGDIRIRALYARASLLQHGVTTEVLRLLKPYARFSARETLAPRTRALVALWLGWAYAWHDRQTQQHARALSLLHEAERIFLANRDAAGRCWVLLGQAQAYFSVDEYRLMRHVLEQAAPLLAHIHDLQAQAWFHDLQAIYARYRSRAVEAREHIDALHRIAAQINDPMLMARASAQEAALGVDTGAAPSGVLQHARRSRDIVTGHNLRSLYALLTGYRAEIQALIRTGALDEARDLLGQAQESIGTLAAADAFIGPQRAQLAVLKSEAGAAEAVLDELLDRTRGSYYRILMTSALLLKAELKLAGGKITAALEALDEVDESIRETAYRRHAVESALLRIRCGLAAGELDAAKKTLREVRQAPELSSLLPLAARRYAAEGAVSEADGDGEEALASYLEAVAAYRLIQDVHGLRAIEQAVERVRARFSLGAVPIAALLARSAIKQELVADAWLQYVRDLLPGAHARVYRSEAGKTTTVFAEYGPPSPDGVSAGDVANQADAEPSLELALCEQCDTTIGMRLTVPDEQRFSSALPEIRKWLPVVRLAFEHAELRGETSEACHCHDHADAGSHGDEEFVAHSPAMESVLAEARRIRAGVNPVLITGERGTGKTQLARTIHAMGDRRHGHLETVDCAALDPAEAVEVLFGTVETPGALARATGGTLVLDHVDRLPGEAQQRLVQYLRTASPNDPRQTARLVALSYVPADELVRSARMREDLYYAVNMISLHLPPLKERREDIPLLARHLLRSMKPRGLPEPVITAAAMEALESFDWPGNVSELEAELRRILAATGGEPVAAVMVEDLGEHIRSHRPERPPASPPDAAAELDFVLAGAEKAIIEQTLHRHGGRVTSAAEALGLTRQGLYKKMKRLGIRPSRLRERTAVTNN